MNKDIENELPFIQLYATELAVETEYHNGEKILNTAIYGNDIVEQVIEQLKQQFTISDILDNFEPIELAEYLADIKYTGENDYDDQE